MKNLLFLVAAFILCGSCKKAIEDQQQKLVMTAITSGTWIVEQYFEADVNISSEFASYEFKFNDDGSVQGISGVSKTNGTWITNVTDRTITSNFPLAGDTLKKINGVWGWKDSGWDYVKAEKANGTVKNTLHLRKKQ